MLYPKRDQGALYMAQYADRPQVVRPRAYAPGRIQPADEWLLVVCGVILHWVMVVVFAHAMHPIM